MNFRKLLFAAAAFAATPFALEAQVQLAPLETNPEIVAYRQKQLKNIQVCPSQTLTLPFFDDFANNPNGYFPDCAKWQDVHAFINQTMASVPPSIGTATLDGLNPDGRPYDEFADPNTSTAADTLTSQPIDLSGKTAANNVVLSYFYEPQGLGDRPEVGDSLILEFRDTAGNWIQILRHEGVSNLISQNDILVFAQDFIHLADNAFLHANFQFRFRNKAAVCGNNDHWHIDYVYLDENRLDTVAPVYYSDICYTAPPVSPFKKYTAIPWRHFNSNIWNDTLSMRTYNHSNQSGPLDRTYMVEDMANLGVYLMNVQTPSFNYTPSPNSRDSYDTIIGAFNAYSPSGVTQLRSTYTIDNPTSFQNNPIFLHSDTAYRYTTLDNYFAYDDGVPEMRCYLQGVGTQLAVEFTTAVDDTLRGIYFHLPYYTNRNAEQDFINVKVWVNSLSNEVFSRDIYRLRYVGGFGGMHYVRLEDYTGATTPIALPANTTFYVGWQQASTVPVPVGVDRSVDRDDRTYVKVGGNAWANTDINSAVMIRPLLSPDTEPLIIATEPTETPEKTINMSIFPNPNQGDLNLRCEGCLGDEQLMIFNSLGQVVSTHNFQNNLDISTLPQGLYLLTLWQNGKNVAQERLVKMGE